MVRLGSQVTHDYHTGATFTAGSPVGLTAAATAAGASLAWLTDHAGAVSATAAAAVTTGTLIATEVHVGTTAATAAKGTLDAHKTGAWAISSSGSVTGDCSSSTQTTGCTAKPCSATRSTGT